MRNSLSYARCFFYAPALFRWSIYSPVLLREWIEPEQKDSTLAMCCEDNEVVLASVCGDGKRNTAILSCDRMKIQRSWATWSAPHGMLQRNKVLKNMRTRVKGNLLLCWASETREKKPWAAENGRCVFVCIPKTVPSAPASIMMATRRVEKFQFPPLGRSLIKIKFLIN